MNVGDLVILPIGACTHFGYPTGTTGVLFQKLRRDDCLEYDWAVLVQSEIIKLGRQLEDCAVLACNV